MARVLVLFTVLLSVFGCSLNTEADRSKLSSSFPDKLESEYWDRVESFESTVRVYSGKGVGTGVYIGERVNGQDYELYFLTCYHVVKEFKYGKYDIGIMGENYFGWGTVIGSDTLDDIAIIKVTVKEEESKNISEWMKPVKLIPEGSAISRFHTVSVIGYPMGEDKFGFVGSYSGSIVYKDVEYMFTDVRAYPGMSGSPVFSSSSGYLIGIIKGVRSYTDDKGNEFRITSFVPPIAIRGVIRSIDIGIVF